MDPHPIAPDRGRAVPGPRPVTNAPTIRRVRDGAAIEDLCGPHQPQAILVSSPPNEIDGRDRTRTWVVGSPGVEQGAVTTVRVGRGLVTASALLLQPEGAAPIAELIRRSGAAVVSGAADHIGPVAEHLPVASTRSLELLCSTAVGLPQAWPDRVRVAVTSDIPELVALYRDFSLEYLDPGSIEPVVEALVRQRRVLAVEVDGRIVAAQRIEARSRHHDLWAGLTVHPDHRGRGLSRRLDRAARELARIENHLASGVRAPTNGVPHSANAVASLPWIEVRLLRTPSVSDRARRWAIRQVRTTTQRVVPVPRP